MKPIATDKKGRPILGPQPGPQEQMMRSSADIVIGGGAAGGGKSVWLILEGARGVKYKDFTGVIFRRNYTDIVGEGGLWDTSCDIYNALNGNGVRGKTSWKFPAQSSIKFTHLNNEVDKERHQGLAYTYIGFDELTHFSKSQFWYLVSRNRNFGNCKIKPYIRASCNPDADSWVAELIQWWWDSETGYPIPERQGVIRYFIRDEVTDEIEWVSPDYRDENGDPPTSITFIASMLEDNKLMPNLAQYRAKVMKLDKVNRERLSKGNWLISFKGGLFDPAWFEIVDGYPSGMKLIRYWDLAATELDEEERNDPDWTSGAKLGIHDGYLYIVDVNAFRSTPGKSEVKMREQAEIDTRDTDVYWEEEKASAGKFTSEYLRQVFRGFSARPDPVKGTKEERASKWAAWAEFGRVRLVRGAWNKSFLAQAGKFPLGKKDQIDSCSGAFSILVGPKPIVEYYMPHVHMKNFGKELNEFNKIQPQNVCVFISLWMDDEGGIYGGCYLWTNTTHKLKLYNEIYLPYPTAGVLAAEIKEKSVVPIDRQPNFVTVNKILCNDIMVKKEKSSIKRELQKVGIIITEAQMYDERSSIFRVNTMFAEGAITIHSDCIETDSDLRQWVYEDKKIPKGFPMARQLCMMESHIRAGLRQVDKGLFIKPYSKQKMAIQEKLRSGDQEGYKRISEYEHLI